MNLPDPLVLQENYAQRIHQSKSHLNAYKSNTQSHQSNAHHVPTHSSV